MDKQQKRKELSQSKKFTRVVTGYCAAAVNKSNKIRASAFVSVTGTLPSNIDSYSHIGGHEQEVAFSDKWKWLSLRWLVDRQLVLGR
jgi:hypothetical protein